MAISHGFDVSLTSKTENSDLSPDEDSWFLFLKTLFRFWMTEDNPDIRIRLFHSMIKGLKGGVPNLCSMEHGKCEDYLAIDEIGDAYLCNRFSKRDIAHLGNILNVQLSELIDRKKSLYRKAVLINPECINCESFCVCGGGCPFLKWESTGSLSGHSPECVSKKKFVSYIKQEYLKGVP